MDPMFGDLFKLLGQQGPDAWFQTATQLALNVARGDDGDVLKQAGLLDSLLMQRRAGADPHRAGDLLGHVVGALLL